MAVNEYMKHISYNNELALKSNLHVIAATCPRLACTSHSPSIQLPFRLANRQLSSCGYAGFDLSCNNQKQTILTLPSSGNFIVQNINYKEQIVTINDPENCLPKRFLNGDHFNLTDSPLTFWTDTRNYTFLNCSAKDGTLAASISCLSSDYYKVFLVPTSDWPTSWYPCSIISTALVPIYSFQWRDLNDVLDIRLSWNKPDCRSCEAGGRSTLDVGRARDGLHRRQSITELSTAVDQQVQPPRVIVGLDGPTIESYPKIQLDESLELPEPDDKTCAICLCEYQPKETIRTIPDCNHYFHAIFPCATNKEESVKRYTNKIASVNSLSTLNLPKVQRSSVKHHLQ
ncbi:RING-H2 finger protein ATL22-like [Rosa rugosa]|uniref:RING-H2 finger protein ATL22-like n=1 Tax=Rosa rugosa TaxID=74645 RepID=UPI002B40B2DF|nr:RING-H2 finger protein ATL22-like [Rosa rugosa]